MYRIHKILCGTILFALPLITLALNEDTNEIMHITADSTLFNYKNGFDTYEGHVKMNQGSTHLVADRVTTQKNNKHSIEEAIAYGFLNKLAEYTTIPKAHDDVLHAKAKVIKFYPLKSIVVLEGNVTVTQGKNSFQGATIIYNMKEQTVIAPASKNGRATIIIEPNQLKS